MSDKDFFISLIVNIICIFFFLGLAIFNERIIEKQREKIKRKKHYIAMFEDALKNKKRKEG